MTLSTVPLARSTRFVSAACLLSFWIPLASAQAAAPMGDLFPMGTSRLSEQWALSNTGQRACGQTADSSVCQPGKVGSDIKAAQAWAISSDCSGVVVAVLDTGVDASHPDLRSNIAAQRDVAGFGPVRFFANDLVLHGTHVTGIIAGAGNTIRGVCARARVAAIKVGDEQGMTDSDIIQGLSEARKLGARVINLSLGGAGYDLFLFQALKSMSNTLMVMASGNDSQNTDLFPSYPASYGLPNAITVAATDNRDALAGFSNFGKRSVHIAAPGFGILSTFPMRPTPVMIAENIPGAYGAIDGTSMATPFVTGAAALAWTQNPALKASEMRQLLIETADKNLALSQAVSSGARLNVGALVANAKRGPQSSADDLAPWPGKKTKRPPSGFSFFQ